MADIVEKGSPEERVSVIGTLLLALVTAVVKRSPEITETMVEYLQTLAQRPTT